MSSLFDFDKPAQYAVMSNPVAHSKSPRFYALFAAATGQRPGGALERHGDIEALAAVGDEVAHRLFEAARVDLDRAVVQALAGSRSKQRMDERRFAVRDGIAHHRVQRRLIEIEQRRHEALSRLARRHYTEADRAVLRAA